jgi:hypothetical protein
LRTQFQTQFQNDDPASFALSHDIGFQRAGIVGCSQTADSLKNALIASIKNGIKSKAAFAEFIGGPPLPGWVAPLTSADSGWPFIFPSRLSQ